MGGAIAAQGHVNTRIRSILGPLKPYHRLARGMSSTMIPANVLHHKEQVV